MWLIALVVALASAAEPDAARRSPLLAPGASWEKVAGGLGFGEGPVWHPDGYLLFEDVANNRTLKVDASDRVSVFREATGGANGLALDRERRLLVCEGNGSGGGRRLVRIERDGTQNVLADRYRGKRLNSPNDLTIDRRGRIYFTDPRYSKRQNLELDREAVYRVDPDGTLTRVVDSLTRPNGIQVSADGRTLYVAENASPGGVVQLWAFDLDGRGDARRGRILYDFGGGRGIDGMTLDTAGRRRSTASGPRSADRRARRGSSSRAPQACRTPVTRRRPTGGTLPQPEATAASGARFTRAQRAGVQGGATQHPLAQ